MFFRYLLSQTMAALEVALSIFSSVSFSSKSLFLSSKPIKLNISNSTSIMSHNFPLSLNDNNNNNPTTRKLCFLGLCTSTVQEATVEEEQTEQPQEPNQKRKLYVFNLPWSLTAVDMKTLFGQCGTVTDIEIIKQKSGRSRGFAFVTMETAEEALAVIDKFDSQEVSGRIIKVAFAKTFKRPPPPPPPGPLPAETHYKLYVSNLAWKARSSHLREFLSADFNPVSTRILFDSPSGKSTGYGFVSFATRDEAEAAISALDGKEFMGRALRLKFSEKNAEEPESEEEEENNSESQPESEEEEENNSETQPDES